MRREAPKPLPLTSMYAAPGYSLAIRLCGCGSIDRRPPTADRRLLPGCEGNGFGPRHYPQRSVVHLPYSVAVGSPRTAVVLPRRATSSSLRFPRNSIYYRSPRCRSGEIGIRTRLKIWRGQTHVGSSPTSGTIIYKRPSSPHLSLLLGHFQSCPNETLR